MYPLYNRLRRFNPVCAGVRSPVPVDPLEYTVSIPSVRALGMGKVHVFGLYPVSIPSVRALERISY